MAIGWACETHQSLQAEYMMFRRRQRQLLYMARNYQLLAGQAYDRVASAKQHVDLLLHTVMDGVYASQRDGEHECIPADKVSPQPCNAEPQYLFGSPGNEIMLFMRVPHFLITILYRSLPPSGPPH
jgi:hypothetical protein